MKLNDMIWYYVIFIMLYHTIFSKLYDSILYTRKKSGKQIEFYFEICFDPSLGLLLEGFSTLN